MSKITIKIDVSKIDKNKIRENKYTKRDGTEVSEKNYEMDVVEKKEPKLIKDGETWELYETHFVVEKGEKGDEPKYVGVGTSFKNKQPFNDDWSRDIKEKSEEVVSEPNPDDIPF